MQFTGHQQITALVVSISFIVLVFELVRRRKLKTILSWLWMATAVAILLLAVVPDLLAALTGLIGAVAPISTLFFFGLVGLLLVALMISVFLSTLSARQEVLARELALLRAQVENASDSQSDPPGDD